MIAGCTDEIQVVDAGLGALIKRFYEEVVQEWFQDDRNWEEWTGANLTASRKRVLTTHWYGEAYERACMSYNFPASFDHSGTNLTADGSGDHLLKLQGFWMTSLSPWRTPRGIRYQASLLKTKAMSPSRVQHCKLTGQQVIWTTPKMRSSPEKKATTKKESPTMMTVAPIKRKDLHSSQRNT